MCDNQINELRDVLLGCRLAHQEPYVFESIGGPGEQDQEANENGADRIHVPDDAAANDGHG